MSEYIRCPFCGCPKVAPWKGTSIIECSHCGASALKCYWNARDCWLLCEDVMPEAGDRVIFFCRGTQELDAGIYTGDKWCGFFSSMPKSIVTHWMPLHSPPQVDIS